MIELPEARVLASQLAATYTGKTVRDVIANHCKHGFAFYHGDPADYGERLSGKRVTGCQPQGGRVLMLLEDMRLSFHDGVCLHHLEAGEARPDKHQLLVEFEGGVGFYCTIQMYGGMYAYMAGDPEIEQNFYTRVAVEKPSPLTDAFDRAHFDALFEGIKPSLSAKALLASEQRIPGLGNGVLQDILFQARIHPKAKASALGAERRQALFDSVKTTLRDMEAQGGRDTEKDLFRRPGGYRTILSSKTAAYPCPQCGGSITRQAYLGGNVYFCSSCQRR